jgi:hypothetical protein
MVGRHAVCRGAWALSLGHSSILAPHTYSIYNPTPLLLSVSAQPLGSGPDRSSRTRKRRGSRRPRTLGGRPTCSRCALRKRGRTAINHYFLVSL